MPSLTIMMTEAELYALDLIAVDKQVWADNVLTNRARVARDELKSTPAWAEALAAHVRAGGDPVDDWAVLLAGRDAGFFRTARETADAQPTPAPPAGDPVLNRVQFLSMLAILGITLDEIDVAIDAALVDPVEATIAKIRARESLTYARDHPLIALLAPHFELTEAAIDAAWAQALAI